VTSRERCVVERLHGPGRGSCRTRTAHRTLGSRQARSRSHLLPATPRGRPGRARSRPPPSETRATRPPDPGATILPSSRRSWPSRRRYARSGARAHCHQRDLESARGPQGLDDQVLRLPAMGMISERSCVDPADRFDVVGRFRADLRLGLRCFPWTSYPSQLSMPRLTRTARSWRSRSRSCEESVPARWNWTSGRGKQRDSPARTRG
jgi:hypothetical protein